MDQEHSPAATQALTCPQCGASIPGDSRICPACEVDLALVALLAERAYLEGLPGAAPVSEPPEALVPRIGEYLLEQGILSPAQLEEALARQREYAEQGERRLLGQTLVEMGLVDRETLDRAINQQILELHRALQESNRLLEQRVEERTAELQRALARLTELNQLKANLIANVSHELRTPLAHIKGYVELLADQELGPLTEEQQSALEVVLRATGRLQQLIEDLIEFSTASRQGVSLHLQAVSLPALVAGVVERSREKAEKAQIRLKVDVDEELPAVRADPERLGWVLFQLVDNGVKFTPAGGQVEVSAHSEGNLVTISVRDTGIGIPAERIEEIFEPFHQLDGSATRRYGGTGLGLAMVKVILDAHGTALDVESQVGQGSTFRFTLPAMPLVT